MSFVFSHYDLDMLVKSKHLHILIDKVEIFPFRSPEEKFAFQKSSANVLLMGKNSFSFFFHSNGLIYIAFYTQIPGLSSCYSVHSIAVMPLI